MAAAVPETMPVGEPTKVRTTRNEGPKRKLPQKLEPNLVVSTHLKNICQIGWFPQVGVKIKNI